MSKDGVQNAFAANGGLLANRGVLLDGSIAENPEQVGRSPIVNRGHLTDGGKPASMPSRLANSSSVGAIEFGNSSINPQIFVREKPMGYEMHRENVRSTLQPELNAFSPNMGGQRGIKINTSPN